MQIKNIILSFLFSAAVTRAQTVAGEPRCDNDLETYDGCIQDASIYQQEAAAGSPPDRFSRTTQCYYCFQGAESTCGDQYGENPDTLSDEGKDCYNTNMQECKESRGQQCKWFLRGKAST